MHHRPLRAHRQPARPVFALLGLVLFCLLAAGCSKEKAAALKSSTEQARTRAIAALDSTRELIRQTVALPAEGQEARTKKLAAELAEIPGDTLTSEMVRNAMTEGEMTADAEQVINTGFNDLQSRYLLFASMFRSLPEGSYLAAEAVQLAEAHAIRMSVEFLNFARTLGKNPMQFTGRQTLLMEQIGRAKAQTDRKARDELLQRAAADAFQLRADELKARDDAITQCLRAAESFKTCADLIHRYDKITVSDILTIGKELLTTVNDISGQQPDIAKLLEHYGKVEQDIRTDPYWKAVLDGPLGR